VFIKTIVNKIRQIFTRKKSEVDIVNNPYINAVYSKENNQINLHCSIPVKLYVEGDLTIQTKHGEMTFVSEGELISFDSVDSKIYFNSRASKFFNDDDKAIQYLNELERKLEKQKCENDKKMLEFKESIKKELLEEINEL